MTLVSLGDELEPRYGRLGRTYQRITFDKRELGDDPTVEWVTPGHPLFEVVRADVQERACSPPYGPIPCHSQWLPAGHPGYYGTCR
jgi:hypothetical protein